MRRKTHKARVTIDGFGSIVVAAKTAGAAVHRARLLLHARTISASEDGWWKNVHLDWVKG